MINHRVCNRTWRETIFFFRWCESLLKLTFSLTTTTLTKTRPALSHRTNGACFWTDFIWVWRDDVNKRQIELCSWSIVKFRIGGVLRRWRVLAWRTRLAFSSGTIIIITVFWWKWYFIELYETFSRAIKTWQNEKTIIVQPTTVLIGTWNKFKNNWFESNCSDEVYEVEYKINYKIWDTIMMTKIIYYQSVDGIFVKISAIITYIIYSHFYCSRYLLNFVNYLKIKWIFILQKFKIDFDDYFLPYTKNQNFYNTSHWKLYCRKECK